MHYVASNFSDMSWPKKMCSLGGKKNIRVRARAACLCVCVSVEIYVFACVCLSVGI
jgi:hypothetical protein